MEPPARLASAFPAVDALGGYIRVVGGVIIADAHFLSSYIRGVTTVFSIFLALEAALERKTIDPEFSLLSLPLIPLEIATGFTKKLYSWIPREISTSISKGLSTAGTTFLTKVSEDANIHPTTRIVARMALQKVGSVPLPTRSTHNATPRRLPLPPPTLHRLPTKSAHSHHDTSPTPPIDRNNASVVILERIVDDPFPLHRPPPEGAAEQPLLAEASSPSNSLRASSSSTKASSSSSRKLTKEEEDLLAAFPTPSTSRSSSRCSFSSNGLWEVGDETDGVGVVAVAGNEARSDHAGLQTASDEEMMSVDLEDVPDDDDDSNDGVLIYDEEADFTTDERPSIDDATATSITSSTMDIRCCSNLSAEKEGDVDDDDDDDDDDLAFAEGLKLQLELESIQLESSLPSFDDANDHVNDNDLTSLADNFDQLQRVANILDNMNVYYYVLTQLETGKEYEAQMQEEEEEEEKVEMKRASEMLTTPTARKENDWATTISSPLSSFEKDKTLFSSLSSLDNLAFSTPTSVSGSSAAASASSSSAASSMSRSSSARKAALTGAWTLVADASSDVDAQSVASSGAASTSASLRRQQQRRHQQSQRRLQQRRPSDVSLASLSGLDWDYYAPTRYTETDSASERDGGSASARHGSAAEPFLIEPLSFLDDGEFYDEQLPLGLQDLERTTQLARANAILNEYLDEPPLDDFAGNEAATTPSGEAEGSATSARDEIDGDVREKKADASFFSNFLPSNASSSFRGKWSLPRTPDVVRRIIEAPTPKISRRFVTETTETSSPRQVPRQRTWPLSNANSNREDDTRDASRSESEKKRWSCPDVGVGISPASSFDRKEDAASSASTGSSTSFSSSTNRQRQQRSGHKRRKRNHQTSSSIASAGIPGSKKFAASSVKSPASVNSSSSSTSTSGAESKSEKNSSYSSNLSLTKLARFPSKLFAKSHL